MNKKNAAISIVAVLTLFAGSLFVMVSRKLPRRRRGVVGILFAAAFLYIWAELAVGVFTDFGT